MTCPPSLTIEWLPSVSFFMSQSPSLLEVMGGLTFQRQEHTDSLAVQRPISSYVASNEVVQII